MDAVPTIRRPSWTRRCVRNLKLTMRVRPQCIATLNLCAHDTTQLHQRSCLPACRTGLSVSLGHLDRWGSFISSIAISESERSPAWSRTRPWEQGLAVCTCHLYMHMHMHMHVHMPCVRAVHVAFYVVVVAGTALACWMRAMCSRQPNDGLRRWIPHAHRCCARSFACRRMTVGRHGRRQSNLTARLPRAPS